MEGNETNEKSPKKSSKTSQIDKKDSKFHASVGLLCLSILVAVVSVMMYFTGFDLVRHYFQHRSFYEAYYDDPSVEPEVINLFMSYDENLDGKIDPKEFVQIARRMFGKKEESVFGDPQVEEKWDQSGEKITVNATFQPIVLSTMTKFSGTLYSGFDQPLEMLKSWRQVSKPTLTFPVSAFSIFLPRDSYTKLGEPWYIVTPQTPKYGPTLSSRRYVPPRVYGNAVLIYRLLSMFHSRPFTMTRLTPQGTVACIQAYNDKYLKVAFRIHAEFQINEPPLLPFWFSPAQFAGTIVISRDGKHVQSFDMAVPNNRSLNVDMEWLMKADKNDKKESEKDEIKPEEKGIKDSIHNDKNGEHIEFGESVSMEVDIGYVPEMEINSNGPSCLTNDKETECSSGTLTDDIVWKSELTQQKVERILLELFYPFQEVVYHPFKEAFRKAKEQNKPVHHILLWGALDDQSC